MSVHHESSTCEECGLAVDQIPYNPADPRCGLCGSHLAEGAALIVGLTVDGRLWPAIGVCREHAAVADAACQAFEAMSSGFHSGRTH